MTPNDHLLKEIAKLRLELEHAQAEIFYWKDIAKASKIFPDTFNLTGREAALLDYLRNARSICSKEQLLSVGGWADAHSIKIVKVYIYWLRKKLKHLGIKIDWVYGLGYIMSQDSKDRLTKAILKQERLPQRSLIELERSKVA